MEEYQKDFPIFMEEFNKNKIIYLDSAATTQKPKKVQYKKRRLINKSPGEKILFLLQ